MAKTPNYGFERAERDRVKAAKKAEKKAERDAKKEPPITRPAEGSSKGK